MARIRTIKPEFWLNEDLSSVSETACLLAIGLLNCADDEGYFNANEKLVKAAVFPIRDPSKTISGMLHELSSIGYLELLEGVDGRSYGRVINFTKHQRIDKAKPSKIRELIKSASSRGKVADDSAQERNREPGKEHTTTPSAPGVEDDDSTPFRMSLCWEPVKPLLRERCRQAGIDLDNLPEGELADVLGEFRSYWEGRSDTLTERQWQHKLMDQIKKKCVDSRTSGGVIRRSARSGKASANGALSTRDQSLSDCLNDTSWDDPPQLS